MIKSELVQKIARQNPHLYQRDIENIVNAILVQVVAAMARGDRVAFSARFCGGNSRRAPSRKTRHTVFPSSFWKTHRLADNAKS